MALVTKRRGAEQRRQPRSHSATRQRFPAGSWKKKTVKKDKEPRAAERGLPSVRRRDGRRKRNEEREREGGDKEEQS